MTALTFLNESLLPLHQMQKGSIRKLEERASMHERAVSQSKLGSQSRYMPVHERVISQARARDMGVAKKKS